MLRASATQRAAARKLWWVCGVPAYCTSPAVQWCITGAVYGAAYHPCPGRDGGAGAAVVTKNCCSRAGFSSGQGRLGCSLSAQ